MSEEDITFDVFFMKKVDAARYFESVGMKKVKLKSLNEDVSVLIEKMDLGDYTTLCFMNEFDYVVPLNTNMSIIDFLNENEINHHGNSLELDRSKKLDSLLYFVKNDFEFDTLSIKPAKR